MYVCFRLVSLVAGICFVPCMCHLQYIIHSLITLYVYSRIGITSSVTELPYFADNLSSISQYKFLHSMKISFAPVSF